MQRIKKTCEICKKKVVYLSKHLVIHGLSKDEILARCYRQRKRPDPKNVNLKLHKRLCPDESCAGLLL